MCTCSKTASNTAALVGKWWYRAPVVTRAARARSSTDVAAKPLVPNSRRPAVTSAALVCATCSARSEAGAPSLDPGTGLSATPTVYLTQPSCAHRHAVT